MQGDYKHEFKYENMPQIHINIRVATRDKGLTLKELSAKADISYSVLMNKNKNIKLSTVFQIANALEIDPNDLLFNVR